MGTPVFLQLLGKLSGPGASAGPSGMALLPTLLHPPVCTHELGTGPPGTGQMESVAGESAKQTPKICVALQSSHLLAMILDEQLPLWLVSISVT